MRQLLDKRFIPLNIASQGGIDAVLYCDSFACLDDIYNCITARVSATLELLQTIQANQNTDKALLSSSVTACCLLLNDAYSLLDALAPDVLKTLKRSIDTVS